jgi:acyl phosphate:glycerol-3-phosphate acyltransferase
MQIELVILAAAAGYLSGSISFGQLVMRLLSPETDMTKVEIEAPDGGAGVTMAPGTATTAAMVKGPRVGCLIGVLDILKAFLPTIIFRILYPDQPYALMAATGAMAGHNWPVYYRFRRGGRGVSTMVGGFLAVDPLGIVISSGLGMIFGFTVLRDPLIAYLSGLWLMIPWTLLLGRGWWQLIYVLAVNGLFMLALLPELRFYLQARREGRVTMQAGMDATPMGKSMLKLAHKLGLMRDPKA